MNRKTPFAVLLSLVCLSAPSCGDKSLSNIIGNGDIPDISVTLASGEKVSTLSLYGTPSMLCTFNVNEQSSRKTLPLVQSAMEHYRDEIVVVLVSDGTDPEEEISVYWSEHGLSLPYSVQPDGKQAGRFPDRVPSLLVIDGNFSLKGRWSGDSMPNLEELSSRIEKAIKSK